MNEQYHINEPEMKCVVTKRRQTSAELYHYDLQSAKRVISSTNLFNRQEKAFTGRDYKTKLTGAVILYRVKLYRLCQF